MYIEFKKRLIDFITSYLSRILFQSRTKKEVHLELQLVIHLLAFFESNNFANLALKAQARVKHNNTLSFLHWCQKFCEHNLENKFWYKKDGRKLTENEMKHKAIFLMDRKKDMYMNDKQKTAN